MSTHVRTYLAKVPRVLSDIAPRSKDGAIHLRSHSTNAYITQDDMAPSQVDPPAFRLAVKDNIAVLHTPTTCASSILTGAEIPFTATIVMQLQRLGAVVTGKTNMDEFGMGTHSVSSAFGSVTNAPPLESRSAGGSSGGSAVAVSLGDVEVALGTDTGGSVRMPAAYTGVVGFKPSYGMLSRWGVVPYANSFDTVGLLARTVTPIQRIIHELYAQHDPNDPTSLPPSVRDRCTKQRDCYPTSTRKRKHLGSLQGLTFGIPLEYNIAELDPDIRTAWAAAATKIQSLGARMVPVSLPSTKNALSAYYVIAPAEAASNLAKYDGIRYGKRHDDAAPSDAQDGVLYAATRAHGFGDEVKRRILLGAYTLSASARANYFVQAQKVRRLVRRDFDRVFRLRNPLVDEEEHVFDLSEVDEGTTLENKLGPAQVDFLLCPTAPGLPPSLDEAKGLTGADMYTGDVFTVPASLAGLPAVSLPVGLGKKVDGVGKAGKAGLQVVGQFWDDARVLDVAGRLEGVLAEGSGIGVQ